jgi:hypothetical protein
MRPVSIAIAEKMRKKISLAVAVTPVAATSHTRARAEFAAARTEKPTRTTGPVSTPSGRIRTCQLTPRA